MIDVKIITGDRDLYRKLKGLPSYSGDIYLKGCIASIVESDINLSDVTIHNDLLNRDLNEQSSSHRDVLTLASKYYGIKIMHNQGGGTSDNFIECLLDFKPEASHVLVMEDDINVNKSIMRNLQKWLTEKDVVFGSLYNPAGWGEIVDYRMFWGGQALVLKNSFIPKFIYAYHNYGKTCPNEQYSWIDILFSRIAGRYLKVPIHIHKPSLVQHIGIVSAWTDRGLHQAGDFKHTQ